MTEPYPPSEDTFLVENVIRGLKPAGLVADVGCSTGYLTRVLAENALEVVATDINPEALERARENLTPVLNRVASGKRTRPTRQRKHARRRCFKPPIPTG
jgi:methylase of polypeptide subunit release factors